MRLKHLAMLFIEREKKSVAQIIPDDSDGDSSKKRSRTLLLHDGLDRVQNAGVFGHQILAPGSRVMALVSSFDKIERVENLDGQARSHSCEGLYYYLLSGVWLLLYSIQGLRLGIKFRRLS